MMRRPILATIRFYSRAISPAFPPRCRFYPSCSAYAAEAVEVHGAARGTWLAVRRLVKCAPWHPGGIDFVPGTEGPGTEGPGTEGPGTEGPGTAEPGRSSCTAVPSSPAGTATSAARRPHRAAPPDLRRANEESTVA